MSRVMFRCTIHGVDFGGENADPLLKCPKCLSVELERLKADLQTVTKHRDVLLEAIDLKKTVQRVSLRGR